jgi:hypothetical protein
MGYSGTLITNCNSPTVGASKASYAATFDAAMQAVDQHDHTTGKGTQIPTAGIANNAVTRAKLASLGQQLSSSSSTFTTQSTSYVDVTNLSVSLTTTGRPVFLALISDADSSNPSFIQIEGNGLSNPAGYIKFLRDATTVGSHKAVIYFNGTLTSIDNYYPGNIIVIDVPAAGTYTYKVQALVTNATARLHMEQLKLIAFEL